MLDSNRVLFVGMAAAILCCCSGCSRKEPPAQSRIRKVETGDDLARTLGIHLIKYEYDVSAYPVPQGKALWFAAWAELSHGEDETQEWGGSIFPCYETGSVLLAYFQPPLFTNDESGLVGKISVSYGAERYSNERIVSPAGPFKIGAYGTVFQEEEVELDREYILGKIVEAYSPHAKGMVATHPDPEKEKTENKAVIFKLRFELMDK